jgi:hypothetical protein
MTNLEALQEWLDTHECAIKGFTIHPDNKPTAERLAGEILKSLKRLDGGQFEVVAGAGHD